VEQLEGQLARSTATVRKGIDSLPEPAAPTETGSRRRRR
jgi:hypothetical protein